MVTVSAANLIDDMEEGSGSILNRGGRSGPWFTYNDGSDGGVQMPAPGGQCLPSLIPDGGRCGSDHAMRTHGMGFTGYGVGLGFDLNQMGAGTRMPYSVKTFTGIAFWALGPAAGQDVEIQVLEQATVPTSSGGTCTSMCNDHYAATATFTSTWTQIVIPFASLAQIGGFGTKVPWDPTTVLGVQFAVNPALTFDYWIDDIGLY